MSNAEPSDKSPEQLRAELDQIRAELGDTVEELANRVDVPAQVRAKKEDTIARLHASKDRGHPRPGGRAHLGAGLRRRGR